jgi:hypothetical protein
LNGLKAIVDDPRQSLETISGLRNPNSPLAPNPLPRMSRQAGPFLSGNQSRVGDPSKRADSECRFLLRTGAKVKIWELEAPGGGPAPLWGGFWAARLVQEWQGWNLRPAVLEFAGRYPSKSSRTSIRLILFGFGVRT